MDHADHVALLRPGIPTNDQGKGGVWADLGCGAGAFTLALADLLGPGATIHAVDRDGRALAENAAQVHTRFPGVALLPVRADFTQSLDLPLLDGVVMANSLHFVRVKLPVLRAVRALLKPDGRLLLVEYNADSGNPWVPHPLSYPTWERLAAEAGFRETRLLHRVPSRFLREIYSAASLA